MDLSHDNPASQPFLVPGIALLLLVVVFTATFPLFTGPAEFVGDDYYFITENSRVTSFSIDSLRQIWLTPMRIEYFPVTITTYAIEYVMWGDNVKLYRLTNVLIFWGIGLAAWSLAVRCAQRYLPDAGQLRMVAFLCVMAMLLHPANVESVAGISHRKELLYVLFGLLALHSYASPTASRGATAWALLFMTLAQLSKGSGVILPLLLLIWELLPGQERPLKQRLLRLLPFFAAAAAIFAVQFSVAMRSGVVAADQVLSLPTRIGGVVRTLNFMLSKFIWPHNLVFDYDILWPTGFPPVAEMVLPSVVVVGVAWLGWMRRWVLLGLVLLVMAPLAPYLQIVPLAHNLKGQMVFYDHYLLFSTVLCTLPLTMLLGNARPTPAMLAVPALVAGLWVVYDHYLAGFWKTRETLYRRVVSLSPALPKGHLFLGRTYLESERYEEAIRTLNGVFATKQWAPAFAEVHQALGDAYAFSGNYSEAERNYKAYLAYKGDDLKSLQNLSTTLIQVGRHDEAQQVLRQLLQHYPQDQIGLSNMALVSARLGNK